MLQPTEPCWPGPACVILQLQDNPPRAVAVHTQSPGVRHPAQPVQGSGREDAEALGHEDNQENMDTGLSNPAQTTPCLRLHRGSKLWLTHASPTHLGTSGGTCDLCRSRVWTQLAPASLPSQAQGRQPSQPGVSPPQTPSARGLGRGSGSIQGEITGTHCALSEQPWCRLRTRAGGRELRRSRAVIPICSPCVYSSLHPTQAAEGRSQLQPPVAPRETRGPSCWAGRGRPGTPGRL